MKSRVVVLSSTLLAFFSIMSARVIIGPLMPMIIPSFSVTKSLVGLSLTGMWAAYAVTQLPGGVLADRIGERTVVLVALTLTTISSLLLSLSPSFPLFALVVVVLGISAGLYYSPATKIITRTFENRGQALGIHSAGGPLAGLVAPVVAGYLGVRYGWRVGVLLGAAIGLPALLLFMNVVSPGSSDDPAGESGAERSLHVTGTIGEFLGRPAVVYTVLIYAIAEFSFQSFSSFFPIFVVEHLWYDTAEAGVVFGSIFAVSSLAMPLMGRLSDAFRYDLALVVSLSSGSLGYYAFVSLSSGLLVIPAALILGLGLSWGGVLNARSTDLFSSSDQATGFGMIRTIALLVGSLGSVVTGTLADSFGWPVAFGFVAGLHLIAVASLGVNRLFDLGL